MVKTSVKMYSHESKAGVLSKTFNKSTQNMTPIWQTVLVFPIKLGGNFVWPRILYITNAADTMAMSRAMMAIVSQSGITFGWLTEGMLRMITAVVISSLSAAGSRRPPNFVF
jgi:hypothetical protein